MGLFDFVSDAIGGVTDFIKPITGLFGAAAPAVQAYSAFQGNENSAQAIENSIQGTRETNETNIRLAGENRDWQERLAGTAHQREIADLAAAGLNPILSVTKGGGGSATPSGNVPNIQNPYEGVANAVNSANATRNQAFANFIAQQNLDNQTRMTDANIANTLEDTLNKMAERNIMIPEKAINLRSSSDKNVYEGRKTHEETKLIPFQMLNIAAGTAEREQAVKTASAVALNNLANARATNQNTWSTAPAADTYRTTGPISHWLNVGGSAINSAVNLIPKKQWGGVPYKP